MSKRRWHPTSYAEAHLLYMLSLNQDVVNWAQIEAERAVSAMIGADADDLHERRMYAKCALDIRDALLGATQTFIQFRDAHQAETAAGVEPQQAPQGGFA